MCRESSLAAMSIICRGDCILLQTVSLRIVSIITAMIREGQDSGDGMSIDFTAIWESGLDKARSAIKKTLLLLF